MVDLSREANWSRLGFFLLLSLIGVIFYYSWLNNQIVTHGYRLSELRRTEKLLLEEQDKLKAEWATLKRPQNLTRLGLKLGLKEPEIGQKIVIR